MHKKKNWVACLMSLVVRIHNIMYWRVLCNRALIIFMVCQTLVPRARVRYIGPCDVSHALRSLPGNNFAQPRLGVLVVFSYVFGFSGSRFQRLSVTRFSC